MVSISKGSLLDREPTSATGLPCWEKQFMSAEQQTLDLGSEQLVAKLTETALEVTLKHGVAGSSVDLEVDLWQTLGKGQQSGTTAADERERSFSARLGERPCCLYGCCLSRRHRSGVNGSFLELEMGLWHASAKCLPGFCWKRRLHSCGEAQPSLLSLAGSSFLRSNNEDAKIRLAISATGGIREMKIQQAGFWRLLLR